MSVLNEIVPQALESRTTLKPFYDMVQRSGVACSSNGCKHRLAAWAGFWGSNRGCFANSDWFCSMECLERGLIRAVESSRALTHSRPAVVNRMPLGLILMARGIITHEQLKQALSSRDDHSGRIGQILMKRFGVPEEAVTQAIAAQGSCAVFRAASVHESLLDSVPLDLVERLRMVPVHFSKGRKNLYVGFNGQVDRGILYALEHMLECHTEPCIVADSTFYSLLEKVRQRSENQVVIKSFCSSSEIAEMVCNYAAKIRNASVRHTTCGDDVWVRISGSYTHVDFLFARFPREYGDSAPSKAEVGLSR